MKLEFVIETLPNETVESIARRKPNGATKRNGALKKIFKLRINYASIESTLPDKM